MIRVKGAGPGSFRSGDRDCAGLQSAPSAGARTGAGRGGALARPAGTAASRAARRLEDLLARERELWAAGVARIAGVDEAGVGPLAGPVVAAAVVFPPGGGLVGVDDSKRLTPRRREILAGEIRERAVACHVARVEPDEIDRSNIYQAGLTGDATGRRGSRRAAGATCWSTAAGSRGSTFRRSAGCKGDASLPRDRRRVDPGQDRARRADDGATTPSTRATGSPRTRAIRPRPTATRSGGSGRRRSTAGASRCCRQEPCSTDAPVAVPFRSGSGRTPLSYNPRSSHANRVQHQRTIGDEPVKIHEYQAKAIFKQHGVPVPAGRRGAHAGRGPRRRREARRHGRGQGPDPRRRPRQGHVPRQDGRQADPPSRGRPAARRRRRGRRRRRRRSGSRRGMLGNILVTKQSGAEGREVRQVLVEEGMEIAKEYYLAILLDRATQAPVFIASAEGGTEIEEVAATRPEAILKVPVDPRVGFSPWIGRKLAFGLGLGAKQVVGRGQADRRRCTRRSWRPTPRWPRSTR